MRSVSQDGARIALEMPRTAKDIHYDIRITLSDVSFVGEARLDGDQWHLRYQTPPPEWSQRFVENLLRTILRAARADNDRWPRKIQRWRKTPNES